MSCTREGKLGIGQHLVHFYLKEAALPVGVSDHGYENNFSPAYPYSTLLHVYKVKSSDRLQQLSLA